MPLVKRLAVLAGVLVAAAAWSGSALAVPPAVTSSPVLYGYAIQGWRLWLDPGAWTGSPTFTYQWLRCDVVCVDIPGATSQTYSPVAADVAMKLSVRITATNADGSTIVTAGPSGAVPDPSGPAPTFTLSTTHFLVHYESGAGSGITETMAGDVAAMAERSYEAELSAGFPAPVSDGTLGGDGRIDIYVDNPGGGALGATVPDSSAATTSSSIVLDPSSGRTVQTIAHELFHVVQLGIWQPPVTDSWLLEGTAEWMGYKVDGFPTFDPISIGPWDMAINCRDPYTNRCDFNDYMNNGYSRWPFFEYLAERYGTTFIKDVFTQGASGETATNSLTNALAAKGTSLASLFNDWTVAEMTGGFSVASLQTVRPPTYGSTIPTGTASGQIPVEIVAVNHLSVRYVALQRGSGTAPTDPCYAATLNLTVTLPVASARPYFWWSQPANDGTKQPAQALSVNGTTASISLPWDTCDWGATLGYLSLPNPDLSVDAADFRISGTITVDRSTQATATPPPNPVKQHGPTVDSAPAADVPQVSIFGPQVLRIASDAKTLRLIVSSDGSGRLKAALGSLQLGTKPLRAGGNDLRFTLPKTVLRTTKSTRAPKAAAGLLTLTPLSTGGAAGKPITRRVVLLAPTAKVTAGTLR